VRLYTSKVKLLEKLKMVRRSILFFLMLKLDETKVNVLIFKNHVENHVDNFLNCFRTEILFHGPLARDDFSPFPSCWTAICLFLLDICDVLSPSSVLNY
jgi:hypothetical protein